MGGFLAIDPAAVDPNWIYLALVISLWIGVTAAYIPGTGVIEVIAALGMIGSIIVLVQMPTNWLAVMLLVVGISSFIVMPFIQHRLAALAVGGLALQGIGGLLLFDGMSVSPFVILLTLLIPLAYHQWVLLPMLKSINRQPVTERDDLLIGAVGRVTKDVDPIGTINVNSELWTATSDEFLKAGDRVMVVGRSGLQLVVEKVKRQEANPEEVA